MNKQASETTFRRVISRDKLSSKLVEFTTELDYAMRTFKVSFNIMTSLILSSNNCLSDDVDHKNGAEIRASRSTIDHD